LDARGIAHTADMSMYMQTTVLRRSAQYISFIVEIACQPDEGHSPNIFIHHNLSGTGYRRRIGYLTRERSGSNGQELTGIPTRRPGICAPKSSISWDWNTVYLTACHRFQVSSIGNHLYRYANL